MIKLRISELDLETFFFSFGPEEIVFFVVVVRMYIYYASPTWWFFQIVCPRVRPGFLLA